MPLRRAIFDAFICLSLVNLLLLRVWAQLLPAVVNRANLYYMEQAPHWVHYPTVLLVLFVVGGAACAGAAWARRSFWAGSVRPAHVLLLLFLAALNSLAARVTTGDALGAWLDANRARAPIPYPVRRPIRLGPGEGQSPRS